MSWRPLAIVAVSVVATHSALAQERVDVRMDAMLYGDNAEFSDPFREGETLFGNAAIVAADVYLSANVTFSGGVFMNHRFGSDRIAETWRPVFQLTLRSEHHRFLFGTLETFEPPDGFGPDRAGPHGLLPPIQRDTLAFDRPYEAGLQWKTDHPRIRQDAWVNWQRLNTAEARERLDLGIYGRGRVVEKLAMSLAYQAHVVHEGGQLFDTGPLRDYLALGPGVVFEPTFWVFDRTWFESYALFSWHVPDREHRETAGHGHGVWARASGEKGSWRGHLIVWGACDWIKEEGDPNYGSLRLDGTRFAPTRHYGEVGLSRIFEPAPGVEIEGSARLHRIEKHYNYSFRVLSRIAIDFPAWTRP